MSERDSCLGVIHYCPCRSRGSLGSFNTSLISWSYAAQYARPGLTGKTLTSHLLEQSRLLSNHKAPLVCITNKPIKAPSAEDPLDSIQTKTQYNTITDASK
jgi:hypothetical protein